METVEDQNIIEENIVADDDFVVKCVNDGMSLRQIKSARPSLSTSRISFMVGDLIKQGRITREQIEDNRRTSIGKTSTKDRILESENEVGDILNYLLQGYSMSEIIENG